MMIIIIFIINPHQDARAALTCSLAYKLFRDLPGDSR